MKGNILWEMEKHGNKLPAAESGFGFEIGWIIFDGERGTVCG